MFFKLSRYGGIIIMAVYPLFTYPLRVAKKLTSGPEKGPS